VKICCGKQIRPALDELNVLQKASQPAIDKVQAQQ
jgi:hypothetical protein